MMPTQTTPRIYVASLSDYNDGRLYGVWIDLETCTDADTIAEEVQTMLDGSPYAASAFAREWGMIAEEWAIHDYEGFGPIRLSESEQFETVSDYANAIEEHGIEAVEAATDYGDLEILSDGASVYGSWTELAEGIADDMGLYEKEEFGLYVDTDRMARDLRHEGRYFEMSNGSVVELHGA